VLAVTTSLMRFGNAGPCLINVTCTFMPGAAHAHYRAMRPQIPIFRILTGELDSTDVKSMRPKRWAFCGRNQLQFDE